MKSWGIVVAVSVGLTLAGCRSQQPKPTKSTTASSSAVAHKPSAVSKLKWNADKAKSLETYMKGFGPLMQQNYSKVDAKTATKWRGLDLSKVMQKKTPITIDGHQTTVNWLPKASRGSRTKLNVVAVYADDHAGILYLFTLKENSVPRVLVSQAAPKKQVLSTTETANDELKKAFAAIVAGKPATLPAKANDTSSSQIAASSSNAASQPTHAVVFDQSFQGTWYSQNGQMTITGNSIQDPEYGNQPVYDIQERTANDTAALNGDSTKMDPAKEEWGAAYRFSQDGKSWVNVRGWYQSAGAGGFYAVTNRNLGGKTVPVLETASGGGMWVDRNYYPTQALANQYGATIYPDEHTANSQ